MSVSEPRTIVVTGGTAGIGRATAREFARHGCNVAVLARGKDGLEATKRDIEELGGKALALAADVSDWRAVEAAAAEVEQQLGAIDVWVNNAFAGIFSRFMDVTPEEYERVTAVTYLGQVHGTRAALKRMLPRDSGAIILVGSALAYRGIPLQSAYCGAKHAVQGFIDSVRSELLHDQSNVTITMVQMPGVNTPQFDWIRAKLPGEPRPVGKVYQPEVAARAIYFASQDGRKEMLVGLPTIEAVWGNKIASSMLDEYLAKTGFEAQQRPEKVRPGRKDNLFEPVAGDHGAHGSFDEEAVDSSQELFLSEHKKVLGLAALGVAAVAGAGFMLKGMNGRDKDRGGTGHQRGAEALLSFSQPEPSHRPLILVGIAGIAAATTIGWLVQKRLQPSPNRNLRAAEALGAGAAVLCLSVALDSGIEHYRGQFKDRAMFVGPTLALVGLAASSLVAFRPRIATRRLPKIAFAAVGVTGLAGLGFHAYNILKRPGELDALNLFYGAPMGAPAALTLVGLYGLIAGEMLGSRAYVRTRLPSHTAGLIALSLAGTIAEAGLLHFRGAFQDPMMYAPVTIPPIAAAAIGVAAFTPRSAVIAKPLLKATAVLGIAGPLFHAYGIHRNMGGWRNWSQMILQGPPLPAPPAFLGIAIAGLGILPALSEDRA